MSSSTRGTDEEEVRKMDYGELQKLRNEEFRYIIVHGLDLSIVQKKVNAKLEEGFVTSHGLSYGNGRWAQVMIRND
tara:strand:- start:886 stop:1113 length:228 start_codon:yes stop_codon:yes gene_type:complete